MTTYVRVKDPSSGHQFDLPAEHPWITSGEVIPLRSKRWPDVEQARPAKHHIPKVSPASVGDQSAVSAEASPVATDKE